MTNLKKIIIEARERLKHAGIEDYALTADYLAAHALGISRSRLPLLWADKPSESFLEQFNLMVHRRCRREPLQYILEEWSFLDFEVKVSPGALIPRPETEEVFLAAADAIVDRNFPEKFCFVDVCTGTGILGIAMARSFPESFGFLCDISSAALLVAKENVKRQLPDLSDRLTLLQADLLSSFANEYFDVVISNPPYIKSGDIAGLMSEVKDFEPELALDGGIEGLDFISRLLFQAKVCLKTGGLFIFEHGHDQRAQIMELLNECPELKLLKAGDDMAGRERYLILEKISKE
ncbi:MAG: peptide chain release factor N(5)-glutamine methyltransferase [Candidatus Rifleibacteriota bacterium]